MPVDPTGAGKIKPNRKRKHVHFTVSWCYGDCAPTLKIPVAEWDAILAGGEYSDSAKYWYEGERFEAFFQFNSPESGDLQVSYCRVDGSDWGEEGYDGRIADAVSEDGVHWYVEG